MKTLKRPKKQRWRQELIKASQIVYSSLTKTSHAQNGNRAFEIVHAVKLHGIRSQKLIIEFESKKFQNINRVIEWVLKYS